MDDRITRAIIGALRERDRSGHEIWQWLGPTHGAKVDLTEATLYPTLYALEADRLIDGFWLEGERIRRVYRIAGKGVVTADRRGWRTMARVRTEADPILTPGLVTAKPTARQQAEATRRRARAMALEAAGAVAGAGAGATTVESEDESAAVAANPAPAEAGRRRRKTAPLAETAGRSGAALLFKYVDQLRGRLRLSEPHLSDVLHEVRDHLQDCSDELVGIGLSEEAAATEAIARLGPPDALAREVNSAQLTPRRLLRSIRYAGQGAVAFAVLAFAASALPIFAVPIVARMLIQALAFVGLRLYFPETPESRAQLIAAAILVGAFVAGRASVPRIALASRRAVGSVRPFWALLGAIPLIVLALAIPLQFDALTAATVLGVPFAFALGTLRHMAAGDDVVSKRGLLYGMPLVALLLLLPGMRVWYFDPASTTTADASASISSSVRISCTLDAEGTFTRVSVTGVDLSSWSDLRVEFWPAERQGPIIAPDRRYSAPFVVTTPGMQVNVRNAPTPDWWVALTATAPDGSRHTIAAAVETANRGTPMESLLDRLLRR